jgi:Ca2+-transporting ATPase
MKALLALGLLGILPLFGYSLETSRAATFHLMAIGQLFLTYPSRHTWIRPLTNRYLHGAVLGGVLLQLTAGWVPLLSRLLGQATVPLELWVVIFAVALLAWGGAEIVSRWVWRKTIL